MAKDTTNPIIDKLFSVGAHYGLAASRRHPSTLPYLFGAKGAVELFDLEQTSALFESALEYIKTLAAAGKTILFVGGKAEARETVKRTAEALNQPYSAGRWIGGSLTNWSEIKKRLAKLDEYSAMKESGEIAKFTKRERLLIDREIVDLELMFGGLKGLSRIPDALFIVDPKAEKGAMDEAVHLNVPVISLMNSDCDARIVKYPIPANDASRETISWIMGEVARVYRENVASTPAPVQN